MTKFINYKLQFNYEIKCLDNWDFEHVTKTNDLKNDSKFINFKKNVCEFYEKLIDIQLPYGADELINKASIHIKDLSSKNLFNFRHKKRKNVKPHTEQGSDENLQFPSPLYDKQLSVVIPLLFK